MGDYLRFSFYGSEIISRFTKLRFYFAYLLFVIVLLPSFVLMSCEGKDIMFFRKANLAPDFELTVFGNQDYIKGQQVILSELNTQPVVINFWYPSCPPCRLEMPDLEAAYQKYKDQGVVFIGIQALGIDSIDDGQDFVREFGINYAIGPDESGEIVIDYKVVGFPTTLFLNRNRRVAHTWSGVLTGEKLDDLIMELLQ